MLSISASAVDGRGLRLETTGLRHGVPGQVFVITRLCRARAELHNVLVSRCDRVVILVFGVVSVLLWP